MKSDLDINKFPFTWYSNGENGEYITDFNESLYLDGVSQLMNLTRDYSENVTGTNSFSQYVILRRDSIGSIQTLFSKWEFLSISYQFGFLAGDQLEVRSSNDGVFNNVAMTTTDTFTNTTDFFLFGVEFDHGQTGNNIPSIVVVNLTTGAFTRYNQANANVSFSGTFGSRFNSSARMVLGWAYTRGYLNGWVNCHAIMTQTLTDVQWQSLVSSNYPVDPRVVSSSVICFNALNSDNYEFYSTPLNNEAFIRNIASPEVSNGSFQVNGSDRINTKHTFPYDSTDDFWIAMTVNLSNSSGGLRYFVYWNNGGGHRMELQFDASEEIIFNYGVTTTTDELVINFGDPRRKVNIWDCFVLQIIGGSPQPTVKLYWQNSEVAGTPTTSTLSNTVTPLGDFQVFRGASSFGFMNTMAYGSGILSESERTRFFNNNKTPVHPKTLDGAAFSIEGSTTNMVWDGSSEYDLNDLVGSVTGITTEVTEIQDQRALTPRNQNAEGITAGSLQMIGP